MNENTNNASSILDATVDKIRSIADANVIVGDKIEIGGGITVIPISGVSYGFAGGGSDFASKKLPPSKCLFAGGGGGGLNVTPVALLVIKGDEVQMLNVTPPVPAAAGAPAQAVSLIPQMFDKIVALFQKDDKDKKNKKSDSDENSAEESDDKE